MDAGIATEANLTWLRAPGLSLRGGDNATLWRAYTMLTHLESVYCSLKTDLGLRPVFHPINARVEKISGILGLSPKPGGTHRVLV